MLSPTQKQWLDATSLAAETAGHIFPTMAACEAALESRYGQSELARLGNNLFGTKQHAKPIFDTLDLPTKEFINGQWINTTAHWVKYATLSDCFVDRMVTLHRLAPTYPHYAAALATKDVNVYIAEVSKTWSTDPQRGAKVLSIHNAYVGAA